MAQQSASNTKSIDDFNTAKQLELFKELKEKHFSGEVVFSDRSSQSWIFYLYLGRIVYTTGGEHAVRRWRRSLAYYFPQMVASLKSELKSLQSIAPQEINVSWDYHLLSLWVERKHIDCEQATKMIRAVATEILFDITQAKNIDCCWTAIDNATFKHLAMIDSEQQITEAWKLLRQWQETSFAPYSPNLAPLVRRTTTLNSPSKASSATLQALTKLIRGKYTFRDLAVQKQTSLFSIARSFSPYFRLGCLELIAIPDLPGFSTQTASPKVGNSSDINPDGSEKDKRESTIAYIDSNTLRCQIMKKIITGAGYSCITDTGSLNTSKLLRDSSPTLIFINIELAEFSGYELCSLLRQIDDFKKIPIILYSKNIGLGDRVKAKVAGGSELVNEYSDAKQILDTVAKYV